MNITARRRRHDGRGTAMACSTGARCTATRANPWPQCYATLLYRDDNATVLRRVFDEDEAMVRVWAARMLNTTSLPVFVMHTIMATEAHRMLHDVDPEARLLYRKVPIVHGGYWGAYPWYRFVHTKLHAWSLPCKQVAFLDYDAVPLRNLDSVFDECGQDAELCACHDQVTPKRPGLRLPNAGMLVVRANNESMQRWLVDSAESEFATGHVRMHAEQGFLNSFFPNWKAVDAGYNIPKHYIYKRIKEHRSSNAIEVEAMLRNKSQFYLHSPLRSMQGEIAVALGFVDAWRRLREETVIVCYRSGGEVAHVIMKNLGHNLSRTAEGMLAC